MFCSCSARYFGEQPNTHVCPVCLGLPGALPVPNRTAIEWCIKIALALNCKINEFSKFDRKNYFYPDLAKGYQISQYDLPFGHDGYIELNSDSPATSSSSLPPTPSSFPHRRESKTIDPRSKPGMTGKKRIRIRRVHMEEDTGKLTHQEVNGGKVSLIDFNRSGLPLVEIVTEPDFHDAKDVKEYLQKLQQIVRYLDVSDADMEKGEMRLEPNISLKLIRHSEAQPKNPMGSFAFAQDDESLPPYKVEVKNINSFRFVEKAIEFELKRQQDLLEKDETPAQETRGWDETRQKTFSQRSKEDAQDYRYFPEPDIPPIRMTKTQISELKHSLPELPDKKIERFQKDFGLSYYDAEILTRERSIADFFENAISICRHPERSEGSHLDSSSVSNRAQNEDKLEPKTIANWIINKKIDPAKTLPAELIQQILTARQTVAVDEKELEKVINEVLKENPKAVADYKKGKESSLMFLLGQTMKKLGRKGDINKIREMLKSRLV